MIQLTITTGERPLVLNRERNLHWSFRHAAVNDWHTATHEQLTIQRVRDRYPAAGFKFIPIYPKGPLPDTGAVFPATKAIVDACVMHGVIADDNPFHNAWETHVAPFADPSVDTPTIIVVITPLTPAVGHDLDECDCRRRYERAAVKSGR